MTPVVGGELVVPFTIGGNLVEEEPSTFTLKAGYSLTKTDGSFFYGPLRVYYKLQSHMTAGVIGPITDENIKAGLRNLGIFEES